MRIEPLADALAQVDQVPHRRLVGGQGGELRDELQDPLQLAARQCRQVAGRLLLVDQTTELLDVGALQVANSM